MRGLTKVIVFLLGGLVTANGQSDARVYFNGKPEAEYYLANPRRMLSERALERRLRYGIPLDISDVPVDEDYYRHIASIPGIWIVGHSKWMNAVHVQGDSSVIADLAALPFVERVVFASKTVVARGNPLPGEVQKLPQRAVDSSFYGDDTVHYAMHHAYFLHEEGFKGKGVLIAVLDAGFPSADTSAAFAYVRDRGGIKDTYNFVDDTSFVFDRHWHGSVVWSVLGGYLPGELVGAAYEADYCLYITEDVWHEVPAEETYWVMAAERADSMGVDVINTSLGYIDFDNPAYNHTWDDLDGETAFASRGAQWAVRKGIHVVVSAGNAGATSWKKISVPADAEDVVSVGAVDAQGERAAFSSTGNTADGRIKPDVMSWGVDVKVYYAGNFYRLSGTSLSAPVIASLMGLMVQKYPYVPPPRMKEFLLRAADRYFQPDSLYGYGIPDFAGMDRLIQRAGNEQLNHIRIYPNPFVDELHVDNLIVPLPYALWNLQGQLISRGWLTGILRWNTLPKGIYLLTIDFESKRRYFKLIKK